jgi:signal peptidase II
MNLIKKILIIGISVFILAGCDQASKKIAQSELKDKTIQSYLGGSLQFFYIENSGGMLSLGSELSEKTKFILFQVIVPFILLLLFIYTITKKGLNKWEMAALIFFISGGMGNVINRFLNHGKVIDFIMLGVFDYHTGVFNLADFYVFLGLLLLLISKTPMRKRSKNIKAI